MCLIMGSQAGVSSCIVGGGESASQSSPLEDLSPVEEDLVQGVCLCACIPILSSIILFEMCLRMGFTAISSSG